MKLNIHWRKYSNRVPTSSVVWANLSHVRSYLKWEKAGFCHENVFSECFRIFSSPETNSAWDSGLGTFVSRRSGYSLYSSAKTTWFLNQNLVLDQEKLVSVFFPTRAIDSEHNERGPYKFLAPTKQFEKSTFFLPRCMLAVLGSWGDSHTQAIS